MPDYLDGTALRLNETPTTISNRDTTHYQLSLVTEKPSCYRKVLVHDVPIASSTMPLAIKTIANWVQAKESRTITFANAHMLALASVDLEFQSILKTMDLNFPDGAPVVWVGRSQSGEQGMNRVSGPDFMPRFILETVHLGFRHYFYGAAPGVAETAARRLSDQNPFVQIAGFCSPPYRSLSEQEILERCEEINASGADVVWVSLGCPKQERWIYDNRHLLKGKVILAVGQALDIVAGSAPRAPQFVRKIGFEWLFRLAHNPARLWRRYLIYNSIFVYRTIYDLFQPQKIFDRYITTRP